MGRTKDEKRAQALRANLLRRKSQARQRADGAAEAQIAEPPADSGLASGPVAGPDRPS